MTKVSDFISKPVISIFDAKIIGTIGNIYFDEKMGRAAVLSVFNDETSEAEQKYIPFSKLVSIESDAAVIKDSDCVSFDWNTALGAVNPINSLAYTQGGKLLGGVRDVILEGAQIKSFIIDSCEIMSSTLLSHSDNILVFNDTGKPIKLPPKKKMPKVIGRQRIELHYDSDKTIAITEENEHSGSKSVSEFRESGNNNAVKGERLTDMPTESIIQELQPNEVGIKTSVQIEKIKSDGGTFGKELAEHNGAIELPKRIPEEATHVSKSPKMDSDGASKFDFLIGKVLKRNIYGSNKNLLLREGIVVSRDIIDLAKREGRLVQLALHSYQG